MEIKLFKNWKQIWLASAISILAACGTDPKDETSDLDIIDGYVESNNLAHEGDSTNAAVGLRFAHTISELKDVTCSGFRYGQRLVLTAAHCLEQQAPEHKNKDTHVHILSASRNSFQPMIAEKIIIHPSYYEGCLETLSCIDLAIVQLPAKVSITQEFNYFTRPAVFDYSGETRSDGIVVGFGCSQAGWFGSCRLESGFRDNTYSLGVSLRKVTPDDPIPAPSRRDAPYYFAFSGKGVDDLDIQIGAGDSGAPLAGYLDSFDITPGSNTPILEVFGMAIKAYDYENSLDFGVTAPNLALDFSHPKVSAWLKVELPKHDEIRGPVVVPGTPIGSICTEFSIPDSSPGIDTVPLKKEDFGIAVPSQLIDRLNSIKSGIYRNSFASCFTLIFKNIKELEQFYKNTPQYPTYKALLKQSVMSQVLALDYYLKYQENLDKSAFEIAAAYASDSEVIMHVAVEVSSVTPGLDKFQDVLKVSIGRDISGKRVSDKERALTAAMMVLPGAVKAAAKKSGKIIKAAVKKHLDGVDEALEYYKDYDGFIGEAVEDTAEIIGDNRKIVFNTLESTEKITSGLTPGKVKLYLRNVEDVPREKLIEDMQKIGLKIKGQSPDGRFMEFVDSQGRLRAKIHPPDSVTPTHHLHIYNKDGESLNSALDVVTRRSPEGHIPIQE